MIDFISGKIENLTPTTVVIENGGIGYDMEISLQTYEALKDQTEAKVYIYHYLKEREDLELYYGFASRQERDFFRLIISVSGFGAGSARMMLSSMSTAEIQDAIINEDFNRIKSVKGIGLKSAQRMVLELKDKVGALSAGDGESSLFTGTSSKNTEEAVSALLMLGFSRPNINKAIQAYLKQHPEGKTEEIIKFALQVL